MRNTIVELHANALNHNLNVVKQHAPNRKVLAMVKANAYGHNVVFAVKHLQNADGFGVATFEEAQLVAKHIEHNQNKTIVLIEGVFNLDEWQQLPQLFAGTNIQLGVVIHHQQQLNWALAHVQSNITIWLKVNTGMNRLGLPASQVVKAAQQLRSKG